STCGNNAFCHASSLVGDGSTRLRDMTVDPSAETESAFVPTDELGGYLSNALDDPAELTGRLCAIESVSGHETALADAVVEVLDAISAGPCPDLEILRDGDTIVARTNLGRAERIVVEIGRASCRGRRESRGG